MTVVVGLGPGTVLVISVVIVVVPETVAVMVANLVTVLATA
jgi:hypothetical protein